MSHAPSYRALRYAVIPSGADRGRWLIWDRLRRCPVHQGDGGPVLFDSRTDGHLWLIRCSDETSGPAWATCELPAGHRDPAAPLGADGNPRGA